MTRIAVGAFLHETNTFAPTKATYDDFVHGGGWPSMTHGADAHTLNEHIEVDSLAERGRLMAGLLATLT